MHSAIRRASLAAWADLIRLSETYQSRRCIDCLCEYRLLGSGAMLVVVSIVRFSTLPSSRRKPSTESQSQRVLRLAYLGGERLRNTVRAFDRYVEVPTDLVTQKARIKPVESFT